MLKYRPKSEADKIEEQRPPRREGVGGTARVCIKCKRKREVLGGTNRNNKFCCKDCRHAPSV